MLTVEENERLTRVGPGTPMGNLLRRYWHPICGVEEMADRWTKRVRLLGEDLVLFRDRSGVLGLIAESCPHRRASLAYGIPAEDGIRCPYHGWKFDGAGRCLEQPNEPPDSTFKDKVSTAAYPVDVLGGLVFAYLGPQPVPLLPRRAGFVGANVIRTMGWCVLPCNWLQVMENSVDPIHTEWLHGPFDQFQAGERGAPYEQFSRKHVKIDFREFESGIYKHRLLAGQSEDSDDWKIGHPLLFPNILAVGSGGGDLWTMHWYQIRVPIDDTTTLHIWYDAYDPPPGVPIPPHLLERVPIYHVPFDVADEAYDFENLEMADVMAWVTPGRVSDRSREALNSTDKGLTLYRTMLKREMKRVEDGNDPLGLIRDPAQNKLVAFPLERNKAHFTEGFASLTRRTHARYAPIAQDLTDVFSAYSDAQLQERLRLSAAAASPA